MIEKLQMDLYLQIEMLQREGDLANSVPLVCHVNKGTEAQKRYVMAMQAHSKVAHLELETLCLFLWYHIFGK